MAPPQTKTAPTSATRKSPFQAALWNAIRIIIFLIVLSRGYVLLIAYGVVPDFPDPILRALAQFYEASDRLMEAGLGRLGNLAVGNLIFGGLVRYYAAKPLTDAELAEGRAREEKERLEREKKKAVVEKKKADVKKKNGLFRDELPNESEGTIDIRIGRGLGSNLKRNMVIAGRLGQCVVFLGMDWRDGEDVTVRAVDLALSLVIIALEVSGLQWDGGLVEALSGSLGDLVGKKDLALKDGEGEGEKEGEAKLKLR